MFTESKTSCLRVSLRNLEVAPIQSIHHRFWSRLSGLCKCPGERLIVKRFEAELYAALSGQMRVVTGHQWQSPESEICLIAVSKKP